MAFVTVYHPVTQGIAEVPEELVEHHATLGWRLLPGDVNVRDREAVAAFLASPPEDVEQPARSAKVDEWRAYAVAQGLDPAEAEGMTRADLIALYITDSEEPA